VCYSGIHYDYFAFNDDPSSPESEDITLFELNDENPLLMAENVCKTMKDMEMYVDEGIFFFFLIFFF
jgi:hypothetical protein